MVYFDPMNIMFYTKTNDVQRDLTNVMTITKTLTVSSDFVFKLN